MSEWWTYRLSDFLLFSGRAYDRLFERYNADVWPLHLVALAAGLALVCMAWPKARGVRLATRWQLPLACSVMAAGWGWVAWAFHAQRYATINWAATWFGVAFAWQALLWLLCAAIGAARLARGQDDRRRSRIGLALLAFAVLLMPWSAVLAGRSGHGAELFGITPDPTAVGTLGMLLVLRPAGTRWGRRLATALWVVPLLWCVVGGATLWALGVSHAALLPAAAVLALVTAWRSRTADFSVSRDQVH